MLQDRKFDADNQFVFIAGGMAGMMDQMMGVLGDRILVNGQPDVVLPVATQPYRLRLLNGSNARIFKLGWSTGAADGAGNRRRSAGGAGHCAPRHACARRTHRTLGRLRPGSGGR